MSVSLRSRRPPRRSLYDSNNICEQRTFPERTKRFQSGIPPSNPKQNPQEKLKVTEEKTPLLKCPSPYLRHFKTHLLNYHSALHTLQLVEKPLALCAYDLMT